jgi:hypothetical protein
MNSIIDNMIKISTIIKNMRSISLVGKSKLIKSYVLSKIWYLAPIIYISNQNVDKISKIIKWCLSSKKKDFSLDDKQRSGISFNRMALPKNFSILNLPNILARVSSLKAKFVLEFQQAIELEKVPANHLYWLEYSILKDMILNKRICPLFSIRNTTYDNPVSVDDKWIEQTQFAYKFIPTTKVSLPKLGDLVCAFSKNDGISFTQGRVVRVNGKTITIQGSNKRKINKEVRKVFDAKKLSSYLFYKWDHSSIKELSKLIYQNCKNRIFLQSQKKNSPQRHFLEKNIENLITDKNFEKEPNLFLSEGQTSNFNSLGISPNAIQLSKACRENIFSFHLKIHFNVLPIYNAQKNCKLCDKHGPGSWHLFLECKVVEEIEKQMLMRIGIDENKVEKYIRIRKKITREGSKKKELHSAMWTRNWAIWKLYNDFSHDRIDRSQNLEDVLLYRISLEEFRSLFFVKILHEKNGNKLDSSWNEWNLIYKFNFASLAQIIPKNQKISDRFFIF